MKKVAIVGFGRFGELLAKLFVGSFDVYIVGQGEERKQKVEAIGCKMITFEQLAEMDFIFIAVPISAMEETLIKLAPLTKSNQVVVDVCSVKVYPVNLMKKYLATAQILGTHPLFGPDSAQGGLKGLQVAICPVRVEPANLKIIKDFWLSKDAEVLETTPQQHDKDVLYSQAFTYTIAKIILGMNLPEVKFRTHNFNAITQVAARSANNTDQLFYDMLFYNPYFLQMKKGLESSILHAKRALSEIEKERIDSGRTAQ
jgi:prephenate dehydrogenase